MRFLMPGRAGGLVGSGFILFFGNHMTRFASVSAAVLNETESWSQQEAAPAAVGVGAGKGEGGVERGLAGALVPKPALVQQVPRVAELAYPSPELTAALSVSLSLSLSLCLSPAETGLLAVERNSSGVVSPLLLQQG